MRQLKVLALALVAVPGVAVAQDVVSADSVLVPGARIRVISPWIPSERITGTIALAKSDTVIVDTADTFAETRLFNPTPVLVDKFRKVKLPVSRVQTVEVSMGRSRWMGALRGAAIGALAAGAYVGLSAVNGRQKPSWGEFASGALSGVPIGMSLGAPVGWVYTRERWRTVAIQKTDDSESTFAGRR
jgi:hypothetical protein